MNEPRKGTIKTKIGNMLFVNDMNISNIIKDALQEKGYDLIVEPVFNETKFFTGENIEIYMQIK